MPSDIAPVRSILVRARELEQGRPFAEAWGLGLASVEDRYASQALTSTQKAWRDGYERRQSKMPALT